jgi:hypothetical protein
MDLNWFVLRHSSRKHAQIGFRIFWLKQIQKLLPDYKRHNLEKYFIILWLIFKCQQRPRIQQERTPTCDCVLFIHWLILLQLFLKVFLSCLFFSLSFDLNTFVRQTSKYRQSVWTDICKKVRQNGKNVFFSVFECSSYFSKDGIHLYWIE